MEKCTGVVVTRTVHESFDLVGIFNDDHPMFCNGPVALFIIDQGPIIEIIWLTLTGYRERERETCQYQRVCCVQ